MSYSKHLFSLQKVSFRHGVPWLIGIDLLNRTTMVKLQGFEPTFLFRPPNDLDTRDQNELEAFGEDINGELSSNDPQGGPQGPSGPLGQVTSLDEVKMTPFISFTNQRLDTLLKVTCSVYKFKDTVAAFKRRGPCYHHDFDMRNMLLQQLGLKYQDWITCPTTTNRPAETLAPNQEFTCQASLIEVAPPSEQGMIPQTRKAFIRIRMVSKDGLLERRPYHPNPELEYDRIVAISVAYCGSRSPDPYHVFSGDIRTMSESDLLRAFVASIQQHDPDDIFDFPDYYDTWTCIAARCAMYKIPLALERFRGDRVNIWRSMVKFASRGLVNMEASLKKKVFIPVELYDLYTCSAMDKFRNPQRKPLQKVGEMKRVEHANICPMGEVFDSLMEDVQLMADMEFDTCMRIEYGNISRVSDTDFSETVSRGEQIRVFNTLSRFCLQNNAYIDKAQLTRRPLRFSVAQRPPSFPDPGEHPINVQVRTECLKELFEKRRYYGPKGPSGAKGPKGQAQDFNTFQQSMESMWSRYTGDKEETFEEVTEVDGGSVLKPACRFWGDVPVIIDDFASLYPSIMQAYNISYENLVYDPEMMDLPGVEYLLLQINKDEVVACVNREGIIGKMLKMLVAQRKAIKRRMGMETDSFKKQMYDFEQNSMKVLCNATYGFCGADSKGSMLAVKEVMYMVTSTGRYLQKTCSNYIANKYGVQTIYGDTDSIFTLLANQSHEGTIDEVAARYAHHYDMDLTVELVTAKYPNFQEMEPKHQLYALLFVVADKVCVELSALFPNPISLEPENMALDVYMGDTKKSYIYTLWESKNPTKASKVKVTGMAEKKRDWTPWTRWCLKQVQTFIRTRRFSDIEPFIRSELDRLLRGQVPTDDLVLTKGYKDRDSYKNFNGMHLQVVLRREQRERWPFKERSRLPLLVIEMPDKTKQFMCAEDPLYVAANKLTIDLSYYFHKQFTEPMRKLLQYHPEILNVDALFKMYSDKFKLVRQHQADMSASAHQGGAQGPNGAATSAKPMTIAELRARAMKRKALA